MVALVFNAIAFEQAQQAPTAPQGGPAAVPAPPARPQANGSATGPAGAALPESHEDRKRRQGREAQARWRASHAAGGRAGIGDPDVAAAIAAYSVEVRALDHQRERVAIAKAALVAARAALSARVKAAGAAPQLTHTGDD